MMSVYAIIPARGGSKSLPGKNHKPFAGKPLIAWTIEAAKQVPEISRIIVNTDDETIAEVARTYGAEVFVRPKELAEDLTLDLAVFDHHLKALAGAGELPHMVVDLRATAPLRRAVRIKEGIDILRRLGPQKADSVRAVSKASKHPYKMWMRKGAYLVPFLSESATGIKEPYNVARQMLPEVYQNNGCMNAFWPATVLEKHSMTGEKIAGYLMDEWESVNIDNALDFLRAEYLMKEYAPQFSRESV